MEKKSILRKLTTIFYADVAGYSRLTRQDEVGTHQQVMSAMDYASESIKGGGGMVLRYAGDAILAEFQSVIAATQTAIDIQTGLAKQNADISDSDKIQVRIGINLGEVMQDRGEIFGDGVNLAARLESAAQPGGICISSLVHEQIFGKIDIEFVDGGTESFKNIDKPIRVFYWHPLSMGLPSASPVKSLDKTSNNRKPTLLLRPGKALGSPEDSALLLEGTLDALSSSFANLSGIKLVTSSTDADYESILSVQAMANRFRITATLSDLKMDEQFWSERFNGQGDDLFEILDDLISRLTTSIRFEVYEREGIRLKSIPLDSKTNEELLSEAGMHLYRPYIDDYKRAGQLLDHAIECGDTGFITFAMRAAAAIYESQCGYRSIAPQDRELAINCIARAIEGNSRIEWVQHTHALVQLYCHDDIDAALRASQLSLDLNPSMTVTKFSRGLALLFAGEVQSTIELCSKGVEKYPRYMGNYWLYSVLALAQLTIGRFDDAINSARRADSIFPNALLPLLVTVSASQLLGDQDGVNSSRSKFLAAYPDFRLSEMAPFPFREAAHWDTFLSTMLASGLPD